MQRDGERHGFVLPAAMRPTLGQFGEQRDEMTMAFPRISLSRQHAERIRNENKSETCTIRVTVREGGREVLERYLGCLQNWQVESVPVEYRLRIVLRDPPPEASL